MGYYPIWKPSNYMFSGHESWVAAPSNFKKIDDSFVLIEQAFRGIESIKSCTYTIVFTHTNGTTASFSNASGTLMWCYINDVGSCTNWDVAKPDATKDFYFVLYKSDCGISSIQNTRCGFSIQYVKKTINGSISSSASNELFKQYFLERGFTDIEIDYSQSSVKYCRIDVIGNGNPIFMWPEGATVKLYLSSYFALGRNEDGTIKEGQIPLFETSDAKITKFYRVQFLRGGLSDSYYGASIPKTTNKGWCIEPPLVGFGSDQKGTWYRLDLTNIQFLFETPFTTDTDLQNYLRRKYLATKTNTNSTDSSKYSGLCSMSELATMLGFSNIEHSNSGKSAENTPVKIYEQIVDNQVCYGVCFGQETHDKQSMGGYSNLLTSGETINFTEVSDRYFKFKDWRWNGSINDAPGKGTWTSPLTKRSFDKSMHFIDRVRWVHNLSYNNISIQGDTIEAILRKHGATNISNANSWTYNSTLKCWTGVDRITFKLENYDVVKTGSNTSPENPSYSYKDSGDYLTLPVNSLRTINNTTVYCIYLDNFALCRFSRNSFLYNGSSSPNNTWATLTKQINNYQEYNIKVPITSKEPTEQVTPDDYRINDQSLYATLTVASIDNNKLTTSYSGQYVNETDGVINDKNLRYWGQQPLYHAAKVASATTADTITPSGNMVMIDNTRYNLNNKNILIKCVRTPILDKENSHTKISFIVNPASQDYTSTQLSFSSGTGETIISANFTFYQWDPASDEWQLVNSQLKKYLNSICFSHSLKYDMAWNGTQKGVGYDWMDVDFMRATINNGTQADNTGGYAKALNHKISVDYQTTVFSNEQVNKPSSTFSGYRAYIPYAASQYVSPGYYPKGSFSNIPFQNNYQVNFQLQCTCNVKWPAGTMMEYVDLMYNHNMVINNTYSIKSIRSDQSFTTKNNLCPLGNGHLIQATWAEVYTTPAKNSFDYMSQLTLYYSYCSDSYPDPVDRQDAFFAWKYRTQFYFGVYVHNPGSIPYYEEYLLIKELA